MKVLLTGIEGYIGSLLGPMLANRGYDVVGLDTGYYRDGWLYSDGDAAALFPRILQKDLRRVAPADLDGIDAVIHLAELSNDPLGANKPEITYAINHAGSVRLATMAKERGISRFIYTSSCSVYGIGDGGILDEASQVNPQTAYAKCKALVERDVSKLADRAFSPTFLRNATAYGASPRMRFDIVLNNLSALAWTTRRIAMTSDGTPWRPLVHVTDICRAVIAVLEAPEGAVRGEIFNVGHDRDNYRIREVAEIVAESFPGCEISFGTNGGDNRSYRVSFEKIHERVKGFECQWTARDGARQLRRVFESIDLSPETFEFRAFTRLRQLEYLQRTRQIDDQFYWYPKQLSKESLER